MSAPAVRFRKIQVACGIALAALHASECGGIQDGQTDASDGQSDSRLDAQADSATERCTGTFGAPASLAELNTSADEQSLRLSNDELTCVYSRVDHPSQTPHYHGVFVAHRASRIAPFSSPVRIIDTGVTEYWSNDAVFPSLTGDGTALFFEGQLCLDQNSNHPSSLCFVQDDAGLGSDADSLPLAVELGRTPPPPDDYYTDGFPTNPAAYPFGAEWIFGNGYITSSASAYYFVQWLDDAGLVNGIFTGQRYTNNNGQIGFGQTSDAAPPVPNTFTPVFTPSGPSDPAALVDHPIVTSDELTLYVSVLDGAGVPHIEVASRASTADAFSSLTPVHELDSAGGDIASWISLDQCRLYLSRKVGGQWDLFVSERAR
jgi:hypothetical protein